MRKLLKTLGLTLLCFSYLTGLAQEQKYIYTIQLGTFIGSKIDDFNAIRPYGFIYADRLDENLHQVYIGGFDTEAPAEALLQKVKAKGYLDAYVTQHSLDKGQNVKMIQLATKGIGEPINWARYQQAGNLYVHLANDQIKIMTGIFSSTQAVSNRLSVLRNSGFRDAFPKNINSILLHRISDFETSGSVIPSSFDAPLASVSSASSVLPSSENTRLAESSTTGEPLASKGPVEKAPPAVTFPASYDNIGAVPKSGKVMIPAIRKDIKRTSALALQRVLKATKDYQGSLDGLYGPGTAGGFEKFYDENWQIRKYVLLSKHLPPQESDAVTSPLQQALDQLAEDTPAAMRTLTGSNHPVAKAYRAYVMFMNGERGENVNQLMNQAIKETFLGKKVNNQPPFDFRATYAYTDLNQLILHLSYVQFAAAEQLAIPCWLIQKHPNEAAQALEPFNTMSAANYRVQQCGGFNEWEIIQVLQSIASDLSSGSKVDFKKLSVSRNENIRMFLLPKPLLAGERALIEQWDANLWNAMSKWGESDPLHTELVTALMVAYFQSQVLLEDYYMNKGMDYFQAKGLALKTLKGMVEPYLESYI